MAKGSALRKIADWQHCCRWCHYYEKGYCVHPDNDLDIGVADHDDWFVHASEEGKVQETIKETLGSSEDFKGITPEVINWLTYNAKISGAKLKQLEEHLKEHLEEMVNNISEEIDSDLCDSLKGYDLTWGDEGTQGLYISNPEEVVCSRWQ